MKTFTLALVGALLLSLVAIANGYPLVYSDTGTYITQALELEGATDRPPYYSLAILPFHLGLTLWAIPFIQGLVVTYILIRAMECFGTPVSSRSFLLLIVTLLIGSSLPWFSSQVMPDFLAPAGVLIVFILAYHTSLHSIERWSLFLLLTLSLAVHFTHFALAVSALVALYLIGAVKPAVRPPRRVALELSAAVLLAFGSFVTYNFALLKKPALSAMGPIFMLARSLEDGPAREFLKTTCPDARFFLCQKLSEIPATSDDIIWAQTSPLQDLYRAKSYTDVVEEARQIVRETFLKYPWWQTQETLKNFGRQLIMTRTGDFNFHYLSGQMKITKVIQEHFPSEFESFRSSAQVQKRIPLNLIATFHLAITGLSLIAAIWLSILLWQKQLYLAPSLFLAIIAAFGVNAFITGSLSVPLHRYGSRMVWLIPLVAILEFLQAQATRRAFPYSRPNL